MSTKKSLVLLGTLVLVALLMVACAGPEGPAGPPGPAGPAGPTGPAGPAGADAEAASAMTCTECHNDTTVIVSAVAQFEENSVHGSGESYIRGEVASCAGCHGHEGAKARINAGVGQNHESISNITNVSPFNCRTCHEIHVTYTAADWALTGGGQPAKMDFTAGTFDGGAGNLCAACHQSRAAVPVATDGNFEIVSPRFGPHYGIEAQMLLGEAGAGVEDRTTGHYSMIQNTCVTCHMGEESNHTYLPKVTRCESCHSGAQNFDIGGVQTEVKAMLEELKGLLVDAGVMNPDTEMAIPGVYSEAVASAFWNYKVVKYDGSYGVHNPGYTKDLLEFSIESLK